jgi:anti-sigma regulatory factor (Ser/Thr protein kinase)
VEMTIDSTLRIPVDESTQVGEARRAAAELARHMGLDATEQGKVAIVAAEAATNLVRHSQGGEILLQACRYHEQRGVELLALDKSPGIADVARSMRDGVSSGSTPGNGLGAMKRLSSAFDVYSAPGMGTALLSRVWTGAQPRRRLDYGGVSVAKYGEEVCGDAYAAENLPERGTFLLADGLGHGFDAGLAAHEARRAFERHAGLAPADIVERAHGALRSTRGAALAVADIDFGRGLVRYAGVGNISAAIISSEGVRHLVSHNGTVGHEMRKLQEFSYPWPSHATLVMHSDGLGSHWDLERYPGLVARDPSLIAGVLYRDFCRGRDDVTVVVAREGAG